MQRKSNDESAWKIPSGDGPPLSLRGFYAKQSPIVNTVIRAFCAPAFLNNRREVVETAPCSRRRPNTFAKPIPERLLAGRPRREGTVRESVRQQTDQGVHDVSETRDLLPFTSRRLLGEEDRRNIGVRFDPSIFRHPSTSSGTRIRASQAQRTWGRGGL